MKKKIISFVGLALFVGAVAFNMQLVNSNMQNNELKLKHIEAVASASGGECCLNGYAQWNTTNPLRADGKDCWCNDRSDVKNECECE